jgi:hypothetical protein
MFIQMKLFYIAFHHKHNNSKTIPKQQFYKSITHIGEFRHRGLPEHLHPRKLRRTHRRKCATEIVGESHQLYLLLPLVRSLSPKPHRSNQISLSNTHTRYQFRNWKAKLTVISARKAERSSASILAAASETVTFCFFGFFALTFFDSSAFPFSATRSPSPSLLSSSSFIRCFDLDTTSESTAVDL